MLTFKSREDPTVTGQGLSDTEIYFFEIKVLSRLESIPRAMNIF